MNAINFAGVANKPPIIATPLVPRIFKVRLFSSPHRLNRSRYPNVCRGIDCHEIKSKCPRSALVHCMSCIYISNSRVSYCLKTSTTLSRQLSHQVLRPRGWKKTSDFILQITRRRRRYLVSGIAFECTWVTTISFSKVWNIPTQYRYSRDLEISKK